MASLNLQALNQHHPAYTCLPQLHQRWKLEERHERAILIEKISKLGHQIT